MKTPNEPNISSNAHTNSAENSRLTIELGGHRPFLIGIGGCGMSALARLMSEAGLNIQGCDSTPSPVTQALLDASIKVGFDEQASQLPEDSDVVIASAAVKPDHPMMIEATKRGLTVMSYPEALGVCMRGRTGIAIAGTHGKSTTTAMLGCALTDAKINPSVIVGATCAQLSCGALSENKSAVGFRVGDGKIPIGDWEGRQGVLIAEACEFNRSFHHLRPTLASIAQIEADHLDIYGSLDAVIEAFTEFAKLIAPKEQGGKLIIAHDGAHRREITAGLQCEVETIGFNPASDWVIGYESESGQVSVTDPDGFEAQWRLSMPGEHNAFNSAVAFALARSVGADTKLLSESFEAFVGLDRRLQLLGTRDGVRVYDDYGHHPTEIDATLRALSLSENPGAVGGRLICVFQPHQHSRTRFFLDEFATSFEHADIVIVPHIYFVRDSEIEKHRVSSADLVDKLRARKVRAMHLYPFEAIIEQLENLCRPGDLLVVMGAGPVWQIGKGFLEGECV
ncbi:MAG: Mur ligase family protein [Phycisphaerales bacterium]|nr:Mur ligase family protein [Phycisphaerales bacterium]